MSTWKHMSGKHLGAAASLLDQRNLWADDDPPHPSIRGPQ